MHVGIKFPFPLFISKLIFIFMHYIMGKISIEANGCEELSHIIKVRPILIHKHNVCCPQHFITRKTYIKHKRSVQHNRSGDKGIARLIRQSKKYKMYQCTSKYSTIPLIISIPLIMTKHKRYKQNLTSKTGIT